MLLQVNRSKLLQQVQHLVQHLLKPGEWRLLEQLINCVTCPHTFGHAMYQILFIHQYNKLSCISCIPIMHFFNLFIV